MGHNMLHNDLKHILIEKYKYWKNLIVNYSSSSGLRTIPQQINTSMSAHSEW
jgi:hypothetical protein